MKFALCVAILGLFVAVASAYPYGPGPLPYSRWVPDYGSRTAYGERDDTYSHSDAEVAEKYQDANSRAYKAADYEHDSATHDYRGGAYGYDGFYGPNRVGPWVGRVGPFPNRLAPWGDRGLGFGPRPFGPRDGWRL